MPPFRKPTLVTLRRQNPGQAWGFRLGGGAEIGQPFQIQKVTPNSLAYLGGLSEGDELVRIGNISLRGLTHDEVQQIILRCTHCIDLFILRDDGREIEPRIERSPEIISEHSDVPYMERPPHFPPISQVPMFKPPVYGQVQQQHQQAQMDDSSAIKATHVQMQMMAPPPVRIVNNAPFMQNGTQDFNRQFDTYSPVEQPQTKAPESFRPEPVIVAAVSNKPDPRVFGMNPRSPSKSPLLHSISVQPSQLSETSVAGPAFPQQQQQQPFKISQSTPTTPTVGKGFSFPEQHDSNNNPVNPDKKIFGLPNRNQCLKAKPIEPIGNHGVQPVNNEKKYFGINVRQRFNSISCDRDWKEALPIVNIPNTDQLLPSQTRQMQTYINQTPPTEKNLRPSLAGMQRRKIRPVWPPPLPHVNKGAYAEGRDSPNSRMYNWPPSRAQSVDRDFGYGEPSDESSRIHNYGRVRTSTRIWPPPSNATPAGRSGYIPDENDEENYAYNPSREMSPAPGWISSHVPITYRPPPGTQYTPQALVIQPMVQQHDF